MSVDETTSTTIARPRSEVAAYAGDPARAPEWYRRIESTEWVTAPPMAVGSRMRFTASFMGRRMTYVYEVLDLTPGERLVMRTADGPFPMETTYTWEDAGQGATAMTLRNRGEPSGFSRLVTPFLGMMIRRANRQDLARLKARMEGGTR